MAPNEVALFLYNWLPGVVKGFKHRFYSLYGPEYIMVVKHSDDHYEVDFSRSTVRMDDLKKETLEKLLGSDTLVEIDVSRWGFTFKGYKSQGCECGAWATKDPDCHSPICPKYRKP